MDANSFTEVQKWFYISPPKEVCHKFWELLRTLKDIKALINLQELDPEIAIAKRFEALVAEKERYSVVNREALMKQILGIDSPKVSVGNLSDSMTMSPQQKKPNINDTMP